MQVVTSTASFTAGIIPKRGALSMRKISSSASFRDERRLAVTNAIVKAVSVPVEKACRLLLMLVAAPALGVARFGSYQFAFAATTMLAVCTDLGMSVWTTRALARDRTRAPGHRLDGAAAAPGGVRRRTWSSSPWRRW